MFETNEIYGVLDLGSSKIRALLFSFDEEENYKILAIEEVDSAGIERGKIKNIEKVSNKIRQVLQQAERVPNVHIKKLLVVFGDTNVSLDRKPEIITFAGNSSHEVTEEDLERLWAEATRIQKADEQRALVHLLPLSYSLDYQAGVREPVGMPTHRLEGNFGLLSVPKINILNIIKCVERAGYRVHDIILQGLSAAEAVLREEEKKAGVCLLNLGGGITGITIYKDGILQHYTELELAGSEVTADIQKGCGLTGRAEELKKLKGIAYAELVTEDAIWEVIDIKDAPPKRIRQYSFAKIIEARMEEIFEYVLAEIDKAGMLKALPAGIVIVGGQANMLGIKEIAEYVTGENIRQGYLHYTRIKGLDGNIQNPEYAALLGAPLYYKNIKWRSPFILDHNQKFKGGWLSSKNRKNKKGNGFLGAFSGWLKENFGDLT